MRFEKYFNAFPFSEPWFDDSETKLFFLKDEDSRKTLHLLDLDESLDPKDAKPISKENFNARWFGPERFDLERGLLYFVSDENNRENFNIYRLDIRNGSIEQLTHVSRANAIYITKDCRTMYYGDRKTNPDGTFTTTLYRHSTESTKAEKLCCDEEWEYRIGWVAAKPSRDSNRIFVVLDQNNQRKRLNLALLDVKRCQYELLLPRELESPTLALTSGDVEGDAIYFWSGHEGFINAYALDLNSRKIRKLTNVSSRATGFASYELEGGKGFAFSIPRPDQDSTEILVVEDRGGKLESRSQIFKGTHEIASARLQFWITSTSMEQIPTRTEFDRASFTPKRQFKMCLGDEQELVHARTKFLRYPSFDGLRIPAYMSLPKGEIKAAVIMAFYGGENYYDYPQQILLESGIAILSPAVRGSWGWGEDWQNKIKGDLGGSEILDLTWAARFIEKELGLLSKKIGLFGGSHGGYAVLRGLTMPANFNGVDAKYPFGFGLCRAGFADLVDFYRTSNIPDWLVNMLGPFDEDLYRDRSPIHHFHELKAPLFIAHGANDARVSPTSMEGFLERLKEVDHPHVLHMMSGQGHGMGSRAERAKYFEAQDEFLKKFVLHE